MFDIRTKKHDDVESVRFDGPYEDEVEQEGVATVLSKGGDRQVYILSEDESTQLQLTREGAHYLIEALEMARDAGWWGDE